MPRKNHERGIVVYDDRVTTAMKMNSKQWLLAIGAGIVVGAGVYLMLPLIVVAVVSAVVSSLVAIGVYRYFDSQTKVKDVPAKTDPRQELMSLLDRLVALNIDIREAGLASDVLLRVETIIDKLRDLLPDLNERYPGHELAWTLNQMARAYLSKVVRPYVALSEADRAERKQELLKSLNGVEAEVDNVADLVQGDKRGDFRAKAAFLRARFVQES
jgi:hypothetical protein